MRVRQQTKMFKDTAVESLSLSIELYNRPSAVARDHAVVMMLAHSFEMLLKASIYQPRRTVRDKGDGLSRSLERCIEISTSDLRTLTPDERIILMAIKQDRDCATHDTIVMSDDLLWVHMRAGVTVFRRLLRAEFDQTLTDLLPNRVIPVSAAPPRDLQLLVEQELEHLRPLLGRGRRRSAEAAARLRPLLALDGSVAGRTDQPTEAEIARAQRSLTAGGDWKVLLPGLATLQIVPAVPGGDVQEVTLRIVKDGGIVPVRRARAGEEAEALAYRGVSPFEEFGIKLTEFGPRLGLTQYQGQVLIEALHLKDDERSYFRRRTEAGNVQFQGLSARALKLGRDALADPGFSLTTAVQQYQRARSRRKA
jgi:hypothetical protein